MNRNKLAKLRKKLEALRKRGGVKSREVEDLAKALGRKLHNRGKEPNWVNTELPNARPLSIPNHTKDLKKGTLKSRLVENPIKADMTRITGSSNKEIFIPFALIILPDNNEAVNSPLFITLKITEIITAISISLSVAMYFTESIYV